MDVASSTMDTISIGDRDVGPGEPTFVIAEAGSNHNGEFEMAKELIDAAAEAGADAVKFQTFRADQLYAPPESEGDGDELRDQFRDLEMPYDWIPELHEYCREQGVLFMSTPFDDRSAEELEPYVPAFKIASLTMSHHPFLSSLADMDKPLIVSTGAHDIQEVGEAVDVLEEAGCSDLVLLQCVSSYPTPLDEMNVAVVRTLAEEFGVQSGLSDHTEDPAVAPAAAVAQGATVVEKHFTLDKSLPGPDHSFALEPDQLAAMVEAIRRTERVLGTGEKRILDVERDLVDDARRAVHAVRDIPSGTELSADDIAVRRPGGRERGLAPNAYATLLGMTVKRDVSKGDGLTWEAVGGRPPE
jgi:N-acetylneuraminate synthase